MTTARVTHVRRVTPDLCELTLERGDIEFQPGDCVALADHQGESRPYSIASGVQEDVLRFLIRRLPGGTISPWLAARRPGDAVEVTAPFGWFRPAHGGRPGAPSVFVATGTGIAPFLSLLRSEPDVTPTRVLHGVRGLADADHREYLSGRCPFSLAVSRESAPPHHRGRVTDLLGTFPHDAGTHYYLCGIDAMIDAVSAALQAHGVPLAHIHREVFFHSDPLTAPGRSGP